MAGYLAETPQTQFDFPRQGSLACFFNWVPQLASTLPWRYFWAPLLPTPARNRSLAMWTLMLSLGMTACGPMPLPPATEQEPASSTKNKNVAVPPTPISEKPVQNREATQKRLDAICQQFNVPGLIVGSFDVNGELSLYSSGIRRMDHEEKITIDDPMHLGSCTKAMTATLLAMLIDEGKLSWDSKLSEQFPHVTGLSQSAWGDVTVDQLLAHQSGIPANAPWGLIQRKNKDVREGRRGVLEWLVTTKRPEKVEFLYSNVNYCLAGLLLETHYDQPWETIIEERLFKPLHMQSASFGVPTGPTENSVPWGHRELLGVRHAVKIDNAPVLGPAGTVHATLADWAKFLRVHLSPPSTQSHGLPLSDASWNHLHDRTVSPGYFAGWFHLERPWASGPVLYHNGTNTYWFCATFLAEKKGYGIFAATNLGTEQAILACDEAVKLFIRPNPTKTKPTSK